jgi:hypothetical protein
MLSGIAKFALPILAGGAQMADEKGAKYDGFRTIFDIGTGFLGPKAYLGGQIILGRDDGVAAGTLDEARARGLMPSKPGPRKVSYPVAGDPVYQTQAPTPQEPLPAPPMSLRPTESVPGAPAAPVLPPPTTPEIAPVAPGYERDYAEETTGLLGQLNAMEKANMDKLGMSYRGLEESDALLDKMIKEKKK